MFVGVYRFDGDPAVLLPAYDRLMEPFDVDAMDLHVCVADASGLTVLDGCPSEADFVGFSTSPDFAAACAGAGLPAPTVTRLGDVQRAHLRQEVRR
jgi:hypothetical protein